MEQPREVHCTPRDSLTPDSPATCVDVLPFTNEIIETRRKIAEMCNRGELDPASPTLREVLLPPFTDEWKDSANRLGWNVNRDGIAIFNAYLLAGWWDDEKYAGYYREVVTVRPYYRNAARPREMCIRQRVFYLDERVDLSKIDPISFGRPPVVYIEDLPQAGFSGIRCETVPVGERKKAIEVLNRYGWYVLSLRPELFHGPGRPHDTERPQRLHDFVELVHKRKLIAGILCDFANERTLDDWRKMLDAHTEFQDYCREYEARGHDRAILLEAAEILYRYQNDSALLTRNKTKWDRATAPLAVAQLIASLELGWRREDGSPHYVTTLSNWYSDGGGLRWGWKNNGQN